MLIMKVDDYISKMKSLGWSDERINQLVHIYLDNFKTEDGRIRVFSGDFNKKNLRIYESSIA